MAILNEKALKKRKNDINERVKEIRKRQTEISGEIDEIKQDDTATTEELKAKVEELEEEVNLLEEETAELAAENAELEEEIAALEEESEELRKQKRSINKPLSRQMSNTAEQRGKELKNKRAVTIGSGNLIKPTKNQTSINDELGDGISSIVDLVKVENRHGMSEFVIPYKKGNSKADKTAEGAAAFNSDAEFGYVSIKPVTITTYSEISREAMNLTDVDYYNAVLQSAQKALRKKVSEYIINSDAATSPTFVGILSSSAIISNDIEVDKIDAQTLRKITLNYGGDEDVIGTGVLLLNKKDLIAFGDVRGEKEKKAIYEITPDSENPNTGIIKDGGLAVKYCINSNLKDIDNAADGDFSMIYGIPHCYEVGLFSDYSVRVSEDFKFANRMLAVLGEVMIGGNVCVKDGFVRVKKSVAAGG